MAVGEVGELTVRCRLPWLITHGYFEMPDATVKAWRNGWFHTGDALRRDAAGNFYFVDRLKDAIRRRGENISSMEVERYQSGVTESTTDNTTETAAAASPARRSPP